MVPVVVVEPRHRDAFTHFGAGLRGVLQEDVVKFRAFNLEGCGFARVTPSAEDQLQALGAIADMELSAGFDWE